MSDLIKTVRTLAWFALIAAIYQELKKPPAERTWHGRVAGIIPYDFRVPTIDRVRRAYWDPDTDTIFTDHVIGVGWAVNIPVLIRKLRETTDQYSQVTRSMRDEVSRRMPAGAHRTGDGRTGRDI